MDNFQLMLLIINIKDKNYIIALLNKYRIPVEESKYC